MRPPLQLARTLLALVLVLVAAHASAVTVDDGMPLPTAAMPTALETASADIGVSSTGRWSWRPTLFALAAFDREDGLAALLARRREAGLAWQPALALGLDVEHSNPQAGFQASLFALGRGPFERVERQLLVEARARGHRQLGARWRLDLEGNLRVERRNAVPLADFQRHGLTLALERSAPRGPAWRLQVTESQRDLPRLAGLDVRRSGLGLGPVFALGRGTSLAPSLVLQHNDAAGARGWHAGGALDVVRLRPGQLWALRYSWSAALYRSTGAANMSLPGFDPGATATRAGADFVTNANVAAQPGLVTDPGLEPVVMPLVDPLEDDLLGLPARRTHTLALYASRRLGARARLSLATQLDWRRDPADSGYAALERRDRRASLRIALRVKLAAHAALVAQAAHARGHGRNTTLDIERSVVHLGLQLH